MYLLPVAKGLNSSFMSYIYLQRPVEPVEQKKLSLDEASRMREASPTMAVGGLGVADYNASQQNGNITHESIAIHVPSIGVNDKTTVNLPKKSKSLRHRS